MESFVESPPSIYTLVLGVAGLQFKLSETTHFDFWFLYMMDVTLEDDSTNRALGLTNVDMDVIEPDSHLFANIGVTAIRNAKSKHEEYLNETKKSVSKLLVGGFSDGLVYSSGTTIFVLYAHTFYNNSTIIGVVVYLYYIVCGILSFVYGKIGDKWRFDYLFIILSIIDVIAFGLLAFSDNFILISIGFIFGGQPMDAVEESFATLLLPIFDNQKFQIRFATIWIFGYLLGPIMAAIVSHYVNYRTVYYIDVSICILLLLYNIVSFWNVQEKLLKKQLTMKKVYNMVDSDEDNNSNNNKELYLEVTSKNENEHLKWIISKEYRFAICNDDENIDNQDNDDKSDQHLYLLLMLLLLNCGLLVGNEAAVSAYFAPYMTERFNSNKLDAILPLALVCFFHILGVSVAELIGEKVQDIKNKMRSIRNIIVNQDENENENTNVNQRIYKFTFCHLFICSSLLSLVIVFIMALIIFPNNIFNLNTNGLIIEYYCLMPVYGFILGIPYMCNELILLELIPSKKVGTIIGIKTFIEYMMRAAGVLVVAILWHFTYNWFWYTQACILAMIMANIAIIVLVEIKYD